LVVTWLRGPRKEGGCGASALKKKMKGRKRKELCERDVRERGGQTAFLFLFLFFFAFL
jgi:hypothetical protein